MSGGVRPFPVRVAPEVRVARAEAEAGRIQAVRASGAVPEGCGPVPAAPARGAVERVRMREIVPGSAGSVRPAGHWEPGEDRPRDTLRVADVFSVMLARARAAHDAAGAAAGGGTPWQAPFTSGQIAVARRYRWLVERRDAGGMRGISLETRSGGGSPGGADGFLAARLDEAAEIAAMERRVGTGAALAIRRLRPSQRGSRATIPDMGLVAAVCLRQRSIGQVLSDYGWVRSSSNREAARQALAGALDRMIGWR